MPGPSPVSEIIFMNCLGRAESYQNGFQSNSRIPKLGTIRNPQSSRPPNQKSMPVPQKVEGFSYGCPPHLEDSVVVGGV